LSHAHNPNASNAINVKKAQIEYGTEEPTIVALDRETVTGCVLVGVVGAVVAAPTIGFDESVNTFPVSTVLKNADCETLSPSPSPPPVAVEGDGYTKDPLAVGVHSVKPHAYPFLQQP